MLYGRFLADALLALGYPWHSLFPVLTSDRSSEREEGREGRGDASEGGAIRATAAAAAAAATSTLAAATAASRCKESCARERAMAKSRGQTCYERRKDLGGKERGREGRETYLRRAKERPWTGSEASQRRQDRRRQPAITSWNVWERVGLDPKGPTTTKSPSSCPSHPFFHINGYSVRPLPCTG